MHSKKVLPNNVRLITSPLKETQTANILVLIRAGSRYENEKLNGASHFVEHMMFKGTERRPTTFDLSKELDGVGAEYNAFTGKDYTAYYIKADARHFSLAIDMLSDMLLNSKIEGAEVEKEKGVIVEEINMYEDNPLMSVEEMYERILFQNNPLSRAIAGTKETVRGLSNSELSDYKHKLYNGKNIVISISGNYQDNHLQEIEEKFCFSSGEEINKFEGIKIAQDNPQAVVKFKETEQVQLVLGFTGLPYGHPQIHALQLLSVVLGGYMSSRLFLSIREREGLAYFIHSGISNFEDTGSFHIQAGLDKARIEPAIKLIKEELNKFPEISEEELQRAKDHIAGKMAIDLEDTAAISIWYGVQELTTGKIMEPSEKVEKIMAVTLDEVIAVARDIINFSKSNMAIIGPFKDEDKFRQLLID